MVLNTIFEELGGELDHSVESDIADQNCIEDIDADFSFDHDVHSRPSSRLGFNRDIVDGSPFSDDEASDEACSEGEYSPIRRVPSRQGELDDFNFDTSVDDVARTFGQRTDDDDKGLSPHLLSFRSRASSGSGLAADDPYILSDGDDSDIDTEVDSDGSVYSDFEDEMPSLSPPSSPPPIDDFSSQQQEPDWSSRRKFSCLPSPLSPGYVNADSFASRQNPTRHYYKNHGHSRHALHHLKWFWTARQDEWEHVTHLSGSKTFDSLSLFGDVSTKLRLPEDCEASDRDVVNTSRPPSPRAAPPLPPLSIHPRRGDLFALRDPYCVHIDRYFVSMPLWTMSKTLWMFDVHTALGVASCPSARKANSLEAEDDLYEDERSLMAEMERSHSVGFSDDSDSTLVESDIEGDSLSSEMFTEPDSVCAESSSEIGDESSCKVDISPISEAESSSSALLIRGGKSKADLLAEETAGPSEPSRRKLDVTSCWPKNWYRRWEVLLQLCFENKEFLSIISTLHPPIRRQRIAAGRSKMRKFFIPDDEEGWNDDDPFGDNQEGDVSARKPNTSLSLLKDRPHPHPSSVMR